MGDTRRLSTGPGWWQNNADSLLKAIEYTGAAIPAATANQEHPVFIAPANLHITKVSLIPATQYVGAVGLVNRGSAAAGTVSAATRTVGTIAGTSPSTLTLSTVTNAIAITAGEVLSLTRATASGDTASPAALVAIEYTLDEN